MAGHETHRKLPVNVCKISIEEVVSPSTFWITDVPDSQDRLQVKSFEEYLRARFQNNQRINFLPELGDIVAAVSPKSSEWCRGIIHGRINYINEDKYEVFFVDYGYKDLVSMSSMAGLSDRMKVHPFQAYQLILYGIVPPEQNNDEWAGTDSDVFWSPDALDYVQRLLSSSAGNIHMKPLYKNGNRIIGEMFLKSDNEYVDLSYLLHSKKLAAFNDDKFWEMNPEASKHLNSTWNQFLDDDITIEDNDDDHDKMKTSCALPCIKDVLVEISDVKDILASRNSSQVNNSAGRGIRTGHRVIRPGIENNASLPRSDMAYSSSLDFENEDCCQTRISAVQLPSVSNKTFVSENKVNINRNPIQIRNMTDVNKSPTQLKLIPTIKESSVQENFTDIKKSPPKLENTCSPPSKDHRGKSQLNALFSILCSTKKQDVPAVPEEENRNVVDTPSKSIVNTPDKSVINTSDNNMVVTPDKSVINTSDNNMVVTPDKSVINTSDNNVAVTPENIVTENRVALETAIAKSPVKNENSLSSKNSSNMSPEIFPSVTKDVEVMEQKERGEVFYHNLILVAPVNSVSEVNFNANIAQDAHVRPSMYVKKLGRCTCASCRVEHVKACKKLDIVHPMFIQSSMWPALCRGLSAIIVASSGSGKTLTYLLPVMSHCASKDRLGSRKPASGPLALILCVDSGRAQDVYNVCCNVIKHGKIDNVNVEIILGGGKENEKMAALINGPDILITMPSVYMKFFQASQYITNFKRLGYLVLEDADLLLERFPQQTKCLLERSRKMKSSDAWSGVQYISVSEKWCSNIEYIKKQFPENSVICIKSPLETAICAKIKPVLHVVETDKKDDKLIEILQNQDFKLKTIIVCNYANEVRHVQEVLKSHNFDVMSIHESNNILLKEEILSCWKDLSLRTVLCSDDVLQELDIKDARFLIHYSLPDDSKTQFENRFYCLKNMYKLQNKVHTHVDSHKVSKFTCPGRLDQDSCEEIINRGSKTSDSTSLKTHWQNSTHDTLCHLITTSSSYCAVHIIVDTQNSQQFPVLMEVMKRLGCDIPDSAKKAVTNVLNYKEKQKVCVPLCDDIKSFGKCWYRSKCQKRHVILPDVDVPNRIPSSGKVKVRVLSVKNAATFIVRLLEHIDLNGKSTVISDDYNNIVSELQSYFSVPDNRCSVTTPKVGDICCLEISKDYYRVKIIEITKRHKSKILKVILLDEGTTKECKESALLVLPENLQEYVPQAVEVLLCRIVPCEGDTCWSDTATEAVLNWIEESHKEDDEAGIRYVIGNIVLSLGSTLWLDPLEYRQFLTNIKTDVLLLTPRRLLIENRYAVDNPEHLDHLFSLCDDAGITHPTTAQNYVRKEHHKEVIKTTLKPQWAHLPGDKLCRVIVDAVSNPDTFFVSHFDFSDSLEDLEKDLNSYLKRGKNKLKNIEVGTFCASLFPEDNIWYRSCVKEIVSESEVEVFFVDHGDYALVPNNELAELPEPFISRLPFQTIECSLIGVKPLNSSWDKEAIDWLSEWQDLSVKNYVYAKVISREEPCHTAGRKYSVVLLTIYLHIKDEYFPLTDELVDKGLATKMEDYDNVMNSLYSDVQEVVQKLEEELEDVETIERDNETVDTGEIQVNNEAVGNGDISINESEADVYLDDSFMDIFKSAAGFLSMYGYNGGEQAIQKLQDELSSNKNGFFVEKPITETDLHGNVTDNPGLDDDDVGLQVRASSASGYNEESVQNIPALHSIVKTPQSQWYQDENTVHIKIMLPDVTQCSFKCGCNELLFSTEVDDNIYYVRYVLFGKINDKEATYCTQGFYVHVMLPKLQEGIQWPQLTRPMTSSLKVSLDSDHINEEIEGDHVAACVSKQSTSAIKKVTDGEEQGMYPPEGYDFINDLFPEGEEEEEEEENKDVAEEVFHDVYDPLN